MNEMMHNVFVIGTAQKAQIPGWTLAGKTGTTDDYKDAWFVGFSGNLVAGVWLGNDDGALTKRVTGGNLPTEVWHNFMTAALKDQQPVPLPCLERMRNDMVDVQADHVLVCNFGVHANHFGMVERGDERQV